MNKFYLFFLAAALMALAGCQNELSSDPPVAKVIYGKVAPFNTGVTTKMTVTDGNALASTTPGTTVSFQWELGDAVVVSYFEENGDSKNAKYVCTNPAEGRFELDEEHSDEIAEGAPCIVTYPFSRVESCLQGVFACLETYVPGNVTKEHMVYTSDLSYEYGADSFTLDAHMPVVHLQMTGNALVGKIKYYGREDRQQLPDPDDEWYTLQTIPGGVQLSDVPQHFYVSTVSVTDRGFFIEIYDTEDNLLKSLKTSTDLAAADNKIVDMPVITDVNALSGN